jgi:hypothetical protein
MSALQLRVLVASYALLFAVPVASGSGQAAQPPRSQPPAAPPMVAANDNRVPAGVLRDGVLTLHLVATIARWQPEGQSQPIRSVSFRPSPRKARRRRFQVRSSGSPRAPRSG